jgi:RND family efflux transporter MFP subunit
LQSRLDQARANLEQAELALTRSRVIAPFDGIVAEVAVAQGDQVGNGQTLMTLYPAAGLEVRAKIPAPHQEEILDRVGRGQSLEATAHLGGDLLRLELTRLSGAADTRGLDGFFRLTAAHEQLRVGSLLTLHLSRPAVEGAVAVPYAALYGGRQVYKVEGGRIQAVQVSVLGELAGERPMLLIHSDDLKRGDQVMTTHLPNAVSGLRVEVVNR